MKKNLFSLFTLVFLAFNSFNAVYAANLCPNIAIDANMPDSGSIMVKLKAGTVIYLELAEDINTETARVNNSVTFTVRTRVTVNGKIVIENNVFAEGYIREVYKATVNSSGSARIEVRNVQVVDGKTINLNGTFQLSPNCEPGQPCIVPAGLKISARTMNDEWITID